MRPNGRRYLARAIALLWAGWWGFFVVASASSEPGFWPLGAAIMLAWLAMLMGSAAAAWRRERVGGPLLAAVGTLLFIANFTFFHNNKPPTQIFLLLTLALPPLLAGFLLMSLSPRPRTKPG